MRDDYDKEGRHFVNSIRDAETNRLGEAVILVLFLVNRTRTTLAILIKTINIIKFFNLDQKKDCLES
jgi:hypothetical protein